MHTRNRKLTLPLPCPSCHCAECAESQQVCSIKGWWPMVPACIMNVDVYTTRIPHKNQYYRCVEAHSEELAGTWDDRYQQDYEYWRPYILDVASSDLHRE